MRGAGYKSTGTLRAELLALAMCLFVWPLEYLLTKPLYPQSECLIKEILCNALLHTLSKVGSVA